MAAGLLTPSVGSAATLLCGSEMAGHAAMACCTHKGDHDRAGAHQLSGGETCSAHAICEVSFSEAAEAHPAVLQTSIAFHAVLPARTEKSKPVPRRITEITDGAQPRPANSSSLYLLNSTFLN